jgi:hypothetical protein
MLKPIKEPFSRLLSSLFHICWQWSYTPTSRRHAQVCPIHKKGDLSIAANYRPISLTSILRTMEMCLAMSLSQYSHPIDLAQDGFRPRRSAFDQAVCLHVIMRDHTTRRRRPPTVAFLDIKAVYDTVDQRIIWHALQTTGTPRPLLSLVAHLSTMSPLLSWFPTMSLLSSGRQLMSSKSPCQAHTFTLYISIHSLHFCAL